MAVLGLRCCVWAFSRWGDWALLSRCGDFSCGGHRTLGARAWELWCVVLSRFSWV